MDLCKKEAQAFLQEKKYEMVVPGALQVLRFCTDLYGTSGINLVPAYLLLAEAYIGLKRVKMAQEFLVLANWCLIKSGDANYSLKARVYLNFGRLNYVRKNFEKALQHLSSSIYCSSREWGPENFKTARGYYEMGLVFIEINRLPQARVFFEKVVEIAFKQLAKMLTASSSPAPLQQDPNPADVSEGTTCVFLSMLGNGL